MSVNDILCAEGNGVPGSAATATVSPSTGLVRSFRVMELLGQGTFGQVVKCENTDSKEHFAIKVIKNKPAYHNQALMEIKILKTVCDTQSPPHCPPFALLC
jgi:serine/threonine protein kinase